MALLLTDGSTVVPPDEVERAEVSVDPDYVPEPVSDPEPEVEVIQDLPE